MNYIHKLPVVLSILAAIAVYSICYKMNFSTQVIYIRVAIGLIVFFILGLYIRSTLNSIIEEIDKKRQEKEMEELMEKQGIDKAVDTNNLSENSGSSSNIDYRVDDDDFSPLTVSEHIKTKK